MAFFTTAIRSAEGPASTQVRLKSYLQSWLPTSAPPWMAYPLLALWANVHLRANDYLYIIPAYVSLGPFLVSADKFGKLGVCHADTSVCLLVIIIIIFAWLLVLSLLREVH